MTLSKSSIVENAARGSEVGILKALDPDFGDHFTFTLKDSDRGAFAISGDKLVVADSSKLDFEAGRCTTSRCR